MKVAQTGKVPAGVVVYQPDTEILGRLLTQLQQDGRRLFIFVNGTLSDPARALLVGLSNVRLVWSEDNVGLGAGLNAIIRLAQSESFSHLMLFDQDSEPSADLPEELLARWSAATATGARVAIIGPLLVPPVHERYRQIRYAWRSRVGKEGLAPVHFVPTSGSLLSLAAFTAIGPFRDDFFVGGIDVEWGFRGWSHGYGSMVARDLLMVHRWGETASPNAYRTPQIVRHSGLRKYYYIRNAVYSLKLPFIPLSWRLRYALRLGLQIGYIVIHRRDLRQAGAVVPAALHDGVAGRLGKWKES